MARLFQFPALAASTEVEAGICLQLIGTRRQASITPLPPRPPPPSPPSPPLPPPSLPFSQNGTLTTGLL